MKKIFYKAFSGKGKSSGKDFYNVTFIEIDEKDCKVFERSAFVDKEAFDKITSKKFKFGDEIALVTAPPAYFGAKEQLTDLELVDESPFFS